MADKIKTYVTCVNYADMLVHSLPTIKWLDPLVITKKDDKETIAVVESYGCRYHISDKWGDTFNKAAALNDVLDTSSWVLLIDADILLPRPFILPASKKYLYGAACRHCEEKENFGKDWTEYPFRRSFYPQIVNKKRIDALAGYFHLWWGPYRPEPLLSSRSKDAGDYDMLHAIRFPYRNVLLPDYEVLHLGKTDLNWKGRVSPKW